MLPADAYVTEESFQRDRALINRNWTCIAREEDVPLPGTWSRGEGRLVVLRGEDLELRAMFDVCRHRGTAMLDGECGRIANFTCPYHGWSYDLQGRSKQCDGLVQASLTTAAGFIFTRHPPPHQAAGVSPRSPLTFPTFLSTTNFTTLRTTHRHHWEVAANWKLLIQNFQESHHFPHVHPALERHTPYARSSSIITDGPWLGGRMELNSEGSDTVSTDGKLHDRPLIGTPGVVHDALLFPTFLLSVQPDYVLTYRLSPLAPARTRIDFSILTHPSVAHREHPDLVDFWRMTNEEDRVICERQQLGLASGVWTPLDYDPSEDGVVAFDRLLERAYAS